MAYKIERKGHIVDSLTVEDGDKALTIEVDINVDGILARYTELTRKIAQLSGGGDVSEKAERLGTAVVELFAVLFGDEQTQKIVDFYGGRYLEMLGDFVPYIHDVLAPQIQDAQKAIAAKYDYLRKR